jgi:CHAT domain-containing protein
VTQSALIVHHEVEYHQIIREAAEDAWDREARYVMVSNQTKATERLAQQPQEEPYALLIIDRDIARDATSPRDPTARVGLDLLDHAMAQNGRLFAIVLATRIDDETNRRINRHPYCRAVSYEKIEDDLRSTLNQLKELQRRLNAGLPPAPVDQPPSFVHVSVRGTAKMCELSYFDKNGSRKHVDGPIELNEELLENLTQYAKHLKDTLGERYDLWEFMLSECGAKIDKALTYSTKVNAALIEAMSLADLGNIVFCFHTDRLHFPILYESLRRNGRFCALEATFARRLHIEHLRGYPLLWGAAAGEQRPLRCLVIEANVKGKFGDTILRPLPHLASECDEIRKFDFRTGNRRHEAKRPVEVTSVSTSELDAAAFRAQVNNQLRHNGPWDVIHYAGHSIYDGEGLEGKGYLFYPAERDGDVEPIPLDVFINSLSHVGLVFLSSCQSSSESIVFGLAEQSVPAIIGFRWPIRDDLALAFAKDFYEAIIVSGIHLGPAFVKARRNLSDNFPLTPHWFAPVLVVQNTPDAEKQIFPTSGLPRWPAGPSAIAA